MRILTGDECGIIKEVIPELVLLTSKQQEQQQHHQQHSQTSCKYHHRDGSGSNNNVQFQQQFQQKQGMVVGIQRLGHVNNADDQLEESINNNNNNNSIPGRAGGIVSLTFLPSNDKDEDSLFQFAALRMNGIVETWKGSCRMGGGGGGSSSSSTVHDERERNVTPGVYRQCNVSKTSVLPPSCGSSSGSGDDGSNKHSGWYMEQPIRPIGMVALSSSSFSSSPSSGPPDNDKSTTTPLLATCDSIGTISLLSAHDDGCCGILARYNAFGLNTSNYSSTSSSNHSETAVVLPHPSSSKNPSNSIGTTLTYTKGQYANTHMATCFAIDTSGTKFAVGGRERSVVVLDVEYGSVIWKSKNLPPDPQTLLQQPMWTTALQFLHTPTTTPSSSSSSSSTWFSNIGGSGGGGNGSSGDGTTLLATGTAYKQVQIYDVRSSSSSSSSSRRPVLYTPQHLLEHRITALCQLHDGHTLAVGDAAGDVHLLDMRKMPSGKRQYITSGNGSSGSKIGKGRRLVGPGGSIRQLYRHPSIPHYLGCVGYDRKLWMWDVRSRKMVQCVYLKQRLNSLLICDDGSWSEEMEETKDEEGRGARHEDGAKEEEEEEERDLEDDEVEDYVDSDDNDDDENDDDDDDDDSGESKETEPEEELLSDVAMDDDDDDDDGEGGGENSTSEEEEEEEKKKEEEDDVDVEDNQGEKTKKVSGKQPSRKRQRK